MTDVTILDDLVSAAVAAGREAYRATYLVEGDAGMAGSAWVSLSPDAHHEPLIEALRRREIGTMVSSSVQTWRIGDAVFANPERVQNKGPQDAAAMACARVLRDAGYHPDVEGWTD